MSPRRLALSRLLSASPEAVWPFVCEPELMNTWSRAAITSIAAGDGGSAGGVGAVRQVEIETAGKKTRLTEVIEVSEPPHRLVYRVVDAPLFRSHHGEITLEREGAKTRLSWTVDFELALSPLSAAVRWLLAPQLEESVDQLAEVVKGAPPRIVSTGRAFIEEPPAPAMIAAAEQTLAEQRALVERLRAKRDPKQWFTRVYVYVTEGQLMAVERGLVRHPRWVLALVPRFHHYYVSNLLQWMGEAPGAPEAHWRQAFKLMERTTGRSKDPRYATFLGLKAGIVAHIEEDLPRALAEVWLRDYSSRCDYARFRADFFLMGAIFQEASSKLLELVPKNWIPWYVRALGPRLPELADRVRTRRFYDVRRARRLAFERGERIAAMLSRLSASRSGES